MTKSKKGPQPSISVSIGGANTGPLTIGDGNLTIVNAKTGEETEIDGREARELYAAIAGLRQQVESEVPATQRKAALEQVDALHAAIVKPNVGKIEAVRDWFVKHIPWIAGAVTSVVVNPIVGKIVEAAGEMAADAFRARFSAGKV